MNQKLYTGNNVRMSNYGVYVCAHAVVHKMQRIRFDCNK